VALSDSINKRYIWRSYPSARPKMASTCDLCLPNVGWRMTWVPIGAGDAKSGVVDADASKESDFVSTAFELYSFSYCLLIPFKCLFNSSSRSNWWATALTLPSQFNTKFSSFSKPHSRNGFVRNTPRLLIRPFPCSNSTTSFIPFTFDKAPE